MQLNTFKVLFFVHYLFDYPLDSLAESLPHDRHTGLADSCQTLQCPRTRTTSLHLSHQNAVRQEDHILVSGLTHAAPELTIAHAQMLFAVPMEAFCSRPTPAVSPDDPIHFPVRSVGNQNFLCTDRILSVPQYHDSHRMIHIRYPDAFSKVPLLSAIDHNRLAIFCRDQRCQLDPFEKEFDSPAALVKLSDY